MVSYVLPGQGDWSERVAAISKTKSDSKELLIEIETFDQSYHIADHRAEIGRVDDEAIIDIRGKVVRSSDQQPLVGAPAEANHSPVLNSHQSQFI